MSIGAEHNRQEVGQGDTAELTAVLFKGDGTAITAAEVASVAYTVKRPDGTIAAAPGGTVQPDGSSFLRYTNTTAKGLYIWTVQFTLTSGEKRTHREEFFVYDPMEVPPVSMVQQVADQVWMRIEDCFDSEMGGPWLRDMTLAYFDQTKVARFVPEGVTYINAWPPITVFTIDTFTGVIAETDPAILAVDPNAKQVDPDQIIIVQSTLLAVIRHLMRSYVEQPNPVGANVVWHDRRDYLQRWGTIYQLEEKWFHDILALWKRQFLNYGKSSLLVSSKAGRLYPTGYRARNAARGFGY